MKHLGLIAYLLQIMATTGSIIGPEYQMALRDLQSIGNSSEKVMQLMQMLAFSIPSLLGMVFYATYLKSDQNTNQIKLMIYLGSIIFLIGFIFAPS